MFRWMYRNIPESTQDSECQYVHIGWMRIYFHSVYWREVCDEVQCSIGKEGGDLRALQHHKELMILL